MASRFEIADEEYIRELKDKSENQNTKKSTNERNFQGNLEEYESNVLDQTLSLQSRGPGGQGNQRINPLTQMKYNKRSKIAHCHLLKVPQFL